MPGTQRKKKVWVPVFAFGETGMATNYWCVCGGLGKWALRRAAPVEGYDHNPHRERDQRFLTMSSTIFLASASSIIVLSWKKSSFSMPA